MTKEKRETEYYRLIYAIDGKPCFVQRMQKGARLVGLFRPVMPNSTFDGWGEVPARMPSHDLTLDGHFTKDVFRVIFAAGIEQYGVFELPVGSPITPPRAPQREGCEFVGWEGFDGVMPAENRRFEAIFKPLTYTVTYVVDEVYRFRVSCPYGAPFPQIAAPRRANHVFSGWSEMPKTMPAHDVSIYGGFEEKRYKLTRMVDGVVFSEEYLPFGAAVDKKMKPVREGYYFSGWRKLPDIMPAHDVEVGASMYPTRYRVDFYLNGEVYSSFYVPYGEQITPPQVAKASGKLFGGWDGLPTTMPAHDVEVRGHLSDILFSLSFVVDGEEIERHDIAEGAPIPKNVQLPSRSGYAFVGWDNLPDVMPGHDLVLHAVYAAVQEKYVFLIDGELYCELTPEGGASLELPEPPDKDGRSFCGWDAPEGDPRTGVITYRGSYTPSRRYTVTYVVEGEEIGRQHLRAGTPLTPPVPEEDDTYIFRGWEELPEVMPARNVTVVGKTKRLKYTLSFEVDGETVFEMALSEGQEIACPALAPREGYRFAGWQNVPLVMPAEDLVIRGAYQIRSHSVIYMLEGREVFQATVPYGAPLTAPNVVDEEDGRTFVGWSPVLTTMPDHDVVIEGAYSDTVCLADVYVDGIFVETVRTSVGASPVLPTYPVKQGHRFIWQDAPALTPEGHIEVHGGYVKNLYTVSYLHGDELVGEERYPYGEAIKPRVAEPVVERGAFLCWRDLPETMPDRDITVRASFAERSCHVTFRLDGRVFAEMDVPVGAPTPNPTVPYREGYQFDGWRNYVSVMPTYNFTAYGTYSRRTYRVTYLVGDEVVETQDYAEGAPIAAPVAPAREHFSFRCWEGLGTHMPAEDITVSARYSGESYRVSFVIDGVLVHTEMLELGEAIEPYVPHVPSGEVFSGWNYLPAFMPAHEVIVTGAYETKNYTVTYKVGEIIYRIDTYEEGDTIVPPAPPEREHEVFAGWANLASVMPDYDFTCVAVYHEVIKHYRFIVDGEVLKEGQCRMGERLLPPDAPHHSGFAFSGWEGFTGVMPGEDVDYIATYVTDLFKIQYFLDDVFYCESRFDAGDRVVPVDAPEMEGYVFGGWRGQPSIMPSDDVVVHGHMRPISYKLSYRTNFNTLVYEAPTPCGTKLGVIEAPCVFGYEFGGWKDEPSDMPARPLVVNGSYRMVKNGYRIVDRTEEMPILEGTTVHKAAPKSPRAVVFVIGDIIRVVVEGICYPVPLPTGKVCLRNSRVVDEEGVFLALRRVWKKYRLPKKAELYIGEMSDAEQFLLCGGVPDSAVMTAQYTDASAFGEPLYRTLELGTFPGDRRYLVSRVHAPTAKRFTDIFAKFGVTISAVNTPLGALAAYLQSNRRMERGRNQMCFFYLPDGLIGVLMQDGQIAAFMKNRYPFGGRDWNVEEETERVAETLLDIAQKNGIQTPLSMIALGGIDRTHVRRAEKTVPRIVKASIERRMQEGSVTLFGGIRRRRPSVVLMGFAYTENRTK